MAGIKCIDVIEIDEVICLSSDTDDESESCKVVRKKKEPHPTITLTFQDTKIHQSLLGNSSIKKEMNISSSTSAEAPIEIIIDDGELGSENGVEVVLKQDKIENGEDTGSNSKMEDITKNEIPVPPVEDASKTEIPVPPVEDAFKNKIPVPPMEDVPKNKIPVPPVEYVQKNKIPVPPVERVNRNEIPVGESTAIESIEDFLEDTRRALTILISTICKGRKENHKEKIKARVWNAFDATKKLAKSIHLELQAEIRLTADAIRKKPLQAFTELAELLKLMSANNASQISEQERESVREKRKQKSIEKIKKELEKVKSQIKTREEEEVDWDSDNEHNSSYILLDKENRRLMTSYYKICDLVDCKSTTDRPTQKSINLQKHGASSGNKSIDSAVERFVNRKGRQYLPDFAAIRNVVCKVNKSEQLSLDVDTVAKDVFTNIWEIIRKRREKDMHMDGTFKADADPAEEDLELKNKLLENDKLRKSEAEVVREFVKLAEAAGLKEKEVTDNDDDVDHSPETSETEEELNEEDEENDREDGIDQDLLEAAIRDELTEDEDEDSSLGNDNSCNGPKVNGHCLPAKLEQDNMGKMQLDNGNALLSSQVSEDEPLAKRMRTENDEPTVAAETAT